MKYLINILLSSLLVLSTSCAGKEEAVSDDSDVKIIPENSLKFTLS